MALQKDETLSNGISVASAYIRIDSMTGTKSSMQIVVSTYASKDMADLSREVTKKFYNFVPSVANDAPNYHKQGYEYLKTLPEFAGATDV